MEKQKQPTNWKKELFGWIRAIVIAVILAVLISQFLIANAYVPTGSMENTIMPGNRIMAWRLAYQWGEPKRGDIVMFEPPDNPEGTPYVKRVIGLPGEEIEGRDGLVYIDGQPLHETYVKDTLQKDFGPYSIPEGSYFMMGDNRHESYDAREWTNKFVKKEAIIGRVVLRYFPTFTLFEREDAAQSS